MNTFKAALVAIPSAVMPHLANPLLLAGFLSSAVDMGQLVGVLALNGLFLLMTQHGLEYPQFYVRLYGLLQPGVLHSRHRKRVFELLDTFLASTYVPAYLAAAFAKRLARLALSAPPAGAMTAVVLAHNLLRRHPGCSVLLHRAAPPPPAGAQGGEPPGSANPGVANPAGLADNPGGDPFLPEEADPADCRALASSLWEFDALRSHYCPDVARFCAVLQKDLTNRRKTAEISLSAVLENSYESLFTAQVTRRLKSVALAAYSAADMPGSLLQGLGDCPAFEGFDCAWHELD